MSFLTPPRKTTDFRRNYNSHRIPDEKKSHGLEVHRRESWQKNMSFFVFSRRFWVKELRHSQNIFAKKRYTSSIVASVPSPADDTTVKHAAHST